MLPLLPPSARIPTVLLTSVFEIVVPVSTRMLLLLFRISPAPAALASLASSRPSSAVVQLVPVSMFSPSGRCARACCRTRRERRAADQGEHRRDGGRGQEDFAHQLNSLTAADVCR